MNLPEEVVFNQILEFEPVQRMKATIMSSFKYASAIGAASLVSSILKGPSGLMIGGIIGSCVAGYVSWNSFQSVPYILRYETTPEQKHKLLKIICSYLQSRGINTIRIFKSYILSDASLVGAIVQIIKTFLMSEMHMDVRMQ